MVLLVAPSNPVFEATSSEGGAYNLTFSYGNSLLCLFLNIKEDAKKL
jgi:hypothetical protein